jgi:hypothetical protein
MGSGWTSLLQSTCLALMVSPHCPWFSPWSLHRGSLHVLWAISPQLLAAPTPVSRIGQNRQNLAHYKYFINVNQFIFPNSTYVVNLTLLPISLWSKLRVNCHIASTW